MLLRTISVKLCQSQNSCSNRGWIALCPHMNRSAPCLWPHCSISQHQRLVEKRQFINSKHLCATSKNTSSEPFICRRERVGHLVTAKVTHTESRLQTRPDQMKRDSFVFAIVWITFGIKAEFYTTLNPYMLCNPLGPLLCWTYAGKRDWLHVAWHAPPSVASDHSSLRNSTTSGLF